MAKTGLAAAIAALPQEWRDQLREEHQQAMQAAAVFARVCKEGRADQLYNAHLFLNESGPDAWRLAMQRITKIGYVSPDIQNAFVSIWIESKMLPLRVGNRPVLAKALRVLMPSASTPSALTLYRGTGSNEHRRRLYSFSWTTDWATARKFAEGRAHPEFQLEGVVLQAVVPAEAILLIRKPEDYYDEGEVVVDPFGIGRVKVVERLRTRQLRRA